jgi:hypothetical protein
LSGLLSPDGLYYVVGTVTTVATEFATLRISKKKARMSGIANREN